MPTAPGEPEVLEADAPPSRGLRALGVVAVVAVLVGGLLWAEGVRRAPAEQRALDRCATSATTAVDRAERRFGAMTDYVMPAFGTAPAEVDAGLMRLVAEQVPAAEQAVDQALADCRDVEVWLFNTGHRQARGAWVDYLRAEQERIRAIAADGGSYFTGFGVVSDLRAEAERLHP